MRNNDRRLLLALNEKKHEIWQTQKTLLDSNGNVLVEHQKEYDRLEKQYRRILQEAIRIGDLLLTTRVTEKEILDIFS